MSINKIRINYLDTINLLKKISEVNLNIEIDSKKNKFEIFYENEVKIQCRLPLIFPGLFLPIENYINIIDEIPEPYIIILIQAGHCSLGYFEDDEITDHKVIQKYMVRKKQGKSQLTYLNKKGKSREGSRIRLANTKAFFEEINDRLAFYDFEDIERIIISCPKKLIPLLFQAKITPPFEKKDERIIKVPVDVKKPNHQELLRINRIAHYSYLDIYDNHFFETLYKPQNDD